jgi:acetyltransferase-like isoleucine patch superfamily enzyme
MFNIKLRFLLKNLSIVDKSFVHGKNLKMGYFNVIKEGCRVGNNVDIQHHTLLKKNTIMGNDVYVDSYFRSSGDNLIGSRVTLRFGSTIARKVYVGDDVFISPNVMTIYSKHTGEKSSGTFIEDGSFVGTAAVIAPNVIIGKDVTIGANSYVSEDCLEEGIYVGVPAKKIK